MPFQREAIDPLVSVIIPTHDRVVLLKNRSIPSLLKQTYTNWELILVGDGPVDDSIRKVVESFADSRMRYVEIERPDYSHLSAWEYWCAGGAAARNKGLECARGAYIAPLDDDDEFSPDHLATCVEWLERGDCDLVYGAVRLRNLGLDQDVVDYRPWEAPETRERFKRHNVIRHSSFCYSARFLDVRYRTDGAMHADYSVLRQIHERGGVFSSTDRVQGIYYGDGRNALHVVLPAVPPRPAIADRLNRVCAYYASRAVADAGPTVRELEGRFVEALDVPDVVAYSGAEQGLRAALVAYREAAAERVEVVLPAYAHARTARAVLAAGLTPVFADIDADTLGLEPDSVADQLTVRTLAVLAAVPHGNPPSLSRLEELATAAGVPLIVDAGSAFEARVGGAPLNAHADVVIHDLAAPRLWSTGGGLVCCRDAATAERVRAVGTASGDLMAEPAAAMALAAYDELVQTREALERRVQEYRALDALPCVRVQAQVRSGESAWEELAVTFETTDLREAAATCLSRYRIESGSGYQPLDRYPEFAAYVSRPLPATAGVANRVLCLPLYPTIPARSVHLVVTTVTSLIDGCESGYGR